MTQITPLDLERKRPDPDVVKMLETALEAARVGEIQGGALVPVNERGGLATNWQMNRHEHVLLSIVGALEALKMEILLVRNRDTMSAVTYAYENAPPDGPYGP